MSPKGRVPQQRFSVAGPRSSAFDTLDVPRVRVDERGDLFDVGGIVVVERAQREPGGRPGGRLRHRRVPVGWDNPVRKA